MVGFSDVTVTIAAAGEDDKSTSEIISTLQGQRRLDGMRSLASQRKLQLERTNSANLPRGSPKGKRYSPQKSKTVRLNSARVAWATSGAKWGDTVALIKARESAKRYIIDPRTSKFIGKWDLIAAFALCYTAIVTPYEVSFLPSITLRGPWTLFIANRVVDLIFVGDLLLQFCIMYPDHDHDRGGAKWISDPHKIACHYLRCVSYANLQRVTLCLHWYRRIDARSHPTGPGSS